MLTTRDVGLRKNETFASFSSFFYFNSSLINEINNGRNGVYFIQAGKSHFSTSAVHGFDGVGKSKGILSTYLPLTLSYFEY